MNTQNPSSDINGKPHLEREKTDECLRLERGRTDDALAAKRKHTQGLAAHVVQLARKRADAVLELAREKENSHLDRTGLVRVAHRSVALERVEEDGIIMQERASADNKLRLELEEQARNLAAVLPLEREKTDRFLLTERVCADEAVAHRDDFMGMVSHDLRNLLAGIATNAKLTAMLASDPAMGTQTIDRMNRIERYVARMSRLIGDLVDVASVDAGKLAVQPRPGDAAELIEEAITPYEQLAQDKGLLLGCATGGQVLRGVFDMERSLQVLANLISNAIRFTPRGGSIILKAVPVEDGLQISVLDTGEGVPEHMREAIFERFGQVAGNDHGGLGLGLYISRCIVTAQGGHIWVENNPAGTGGSAFHFTIPAHCPQASH